MHLEPDVGILDVMMILACLILPNLIRGSTVMYHMYFFNFTHHVNVVIVAWQDNIFNLVEDLKEPGQLVPHFSCRYLNLDG